MEKAGRLGVVVKSVPLSAADMELRRQSLPAWFPDAYDALVARLCGPGPDYPCHFGVQGQQRGFNRFWAVDATAPDRYGVRALAGALQAFQYLAARGPRRQSLIVFVGPPHPVPSLACDHSRFWRLLAGLARHDPVPWPADQPHDPADPRWQWCFAGEPWFVFAGSSAHVSRRSRDLGPCLTVVFQSRRVFHGLGGGTRSGQEAKRKVRRGLARYDQVAPHPHLGDAGASSTHKWRQYVLPDNQQTWPLDACPHPGPQKCGDPQ
jgi:hypothetical protein